MILKQQYNEIGYMYKLNMYFVTDSACVYDYEYK